MVDCVVAEVEQKIDKFVVRVETTGSGLSGQQPHRDRGVRGVALVGKAFDEVERDDIAVANRSICGWLSDATGATIQRLTRHYT